MIQSKIRWVVVTLLLIHAGLLAWAIPKHSPTLNEHAHLVAGISHWKSQRFELYRVNPPLVRMIAALPVIFSDAKNDWGRFYESQGARPVFAIGEHFIEINGKESIWFFSIARWACIPFSLLGGCICYCWAKELYGELAGLFSLTLWCFSPNILAHAQLITPDCGATALGITATYAFWKWLQAPCWNRVFIAGVLLGLAELTKTTWIIFFGLWPMIWLIWYLAQTTTSTLSWKKQFIQLSTVLGLGLYVLNFGYGFEGSFTQLKQFPFVSDTLTTPEKAGNYTSTRNQNCFSESWLGDIPVPLPKNYLLGIDVQKKDFENFGRESYLAGEFRERGWWYYYIYALAIKVPIGYWVILGLTITHALIAKSSSSHSRREFFVLAIPALAVLILVSSQTGINHHMRYILPIFPFVFIWMGQAALWFVEGKKAVTVIVIISLVWAIGSSLWIYPHCLSYFNELVGGPRNGHNHLLHSNIDWGQDLLFLHKWIEKHPDASPLYLCYYGGFSAKDIGVDNPLPPVNDKLIPDFAPPPGWYAISVNYLKGYRWRQPKNGLSYFQKYQPVATAGYSIYIYNITEEKNE